jgi:hypothetical protein
MVIVMESTENKVIQSNALNLIAFREKFLVVFVEEMHSHHVAFFITKKTGVEMSKANRYIAVNKASR